MKFFPAVLVVGLMAAVPVVQTQDPQPPAKAPTFEGCLAKGSAEGGFLLRSAYAVGGTIAGTGLQFRLIANKGVELSPHLNHIVQVTGPVEGTIPPAGRTVPEAELPLIRVSALKMISSECLEPGR